ncbi:MAG: Sortase family enzyme [Candidatus Saccharibacteria bacterium]|nr:Sortase family enzyme [Candidatus Saccharibacteria bacterium]
MPDRARIGLDNPAFYGRLRQPNLAARSVRAPIVNRSRAQIVRDPSFVSPPQKHMAPKPVAPPPLVAVPSAPLAIVEPQAYARPAQHKQQTSHVLQRQAVTAPILEQKHQSRWSRYSRPQIALVGMAGFIFFVGLIVSLITLQTNSSTKAQVAALSSKKADSTGEVTALSPGQPPSEAKPPANGAPYQVAPGSPKLITINSIGVNNARIKPMGITANGELQAPYSIYDAGWYNASAKPGDSAGNGAILIDGHVHGPTLPGVFVAIKKLKAGDIIKITRGDDTVFQYKVVKVQDYDAKTLDLGLGLRSVQPGVPGLNLITCGGPYDKNAGEYTMRTMVFSVQI